MTTDSLRGIHILADVGDELLDRLRSYGDTVTYKAGKIILKQGGAGDALYLILEGSVGAYTSDARGGENHLRTIGSGGHFGEVGVLEKGQRTANVRATSDCVLFRISAEAFGKLKQDPALAVPILSGLCRSLGLRLADVTNRLTEVWASKNSWTI